MIAIVVLFSSLAALTAVIAVATDVALGRASYRRTFGWTAVAYGSLTVAAVALHLPLWASLYAAIGAIFAWLWWHSGGGDGTKRRLRRLRARFAGVRRTAPATAMAVTR